MEQMDKQKEIKLAMNGKMCVMMAGVILIFTAVTSTVLYGINLFMVAQQAAQGVEECVEILEQTGISEGVVRGLGISLIILAVAEIVTGVIGVFFSNRVDKAQTTKKAALALLVMELIVQICMFLSGTLSLGMLFTSIVIPLFMLWGANSLSKLAKADPERVYAVKTKKNGGVKKQQQVKSQKSLRERAQMKAAQEEPAEEMVPEKETEEKISEEKVEK